MKETFCSPGRGGISVATTEYFFLFFQIKLETVPAAMNIVIETTVSWREVVVSAFIIIGIGCPRPRPGPRI